MRSIGVALAVALAAGTAHAGDFASYDGRDAVRDGVGGTKVVTDGVEFWTAGTPPHHYRILGVLTDRRGMGLFSGNPLGPSVAKHIRSLGGDAAIVLDHDERVSGAMVINGSVGLARRQTTQLLVVKYEDPASP
jgi:hypothetical protein